MTTSETREEMAMARQPHGAALALAGVGVPQHFGAGEAQQHFDAFQQCGLGRFVPGRAKQDAGARSLLCLRQRHAV